MWRWHNRMRKGWSWREFTSGSHRLTKTSLESMVRIIHVSVRAHRLDRSGRTWNCTTTMRSHVMKWPFGIWWGGYIFCNVQWSSYFNIAAVMSFRVVRGCPANSSSRSFIREVFVWHNISIPYARRQNDPARGNDIFCQFRTRQSMRDFAAILFFLTEITFTTITKLMC